MIRIIFVILALVFAQLANGQDACATALMNLEANTTCSTALEGGNVDAFCAETCLNLYSAVTTSCNASVSQITASYIELFNV